MATDKSATIGLSEDQLKKLRELRQLNVDSSKGFEECADMVESESLASAFREIAEGRRDQAGQLESLIDWHDDAEEENGSYLAALHRAWTKVRAACTSDDMGAVLIEAERGEDEIKGAYEEAIDCCSDTPISQTLHKQYESVKCVRDRIKSLRDTHND